PWMTFVLAVFEFGLLLVLASVLQLDLMIWAAAIFYWVVWILAVVTRIVVFPIASITYLESAAEFRRTQWSIPATQASVPILAAADAPGPGRGAGIFEQGGGGGGGASAIQQPISKQPSPSGIHASPFAAGGGVGVGSGTALMLVETAPEAGRELVVRDTLTIGRDGCDVNLADPLISRRHAEVESGGGTLRISDLGSSNGTFVNGRPIGADHDLAEGDEVQIGDTTWSVHAGRASDAPAGVGGGNLTRIRGSIPSPSADPMPSAIQRFPGFAPGAAVAPPAFSQPEPRRGASAARRVEATYVAYGITGATAIAVIAFLAAR
ncbi:MAG: FHA domain-containing protein, partial [Solirubrobacterales bacterium]|nr:FHA domain-containing protein [Solirubrobacterales bacterium]